MTRQWWPAKHIFSWLTLCDCAECNGSQVIWFTWVFSQKHNAALFSSKCETFALQAGA